jgi:UDPglucose 6-dehydrogenase
MATPAETAGVARDRVRVAVIGAGYVGIPTAVLLSHFGHDVVVAERDSHRRDTLMAGRSPIMEEGLEEILASCLASGRLRIVADAQEAVADAKVIFLCVATPTGDNGNADLTQIDAAVIEIAPALSDGAIVVNKSTVPVGTAERVARLIDRAAVSVVSNPEFLREGTAVRDSFNPDRTVVGSDDVEAAKAVGQLFSPTGATMHLTNARTAELIKYAANAFLATKISYINSIAQLCDAVGADVIDLVKGVGMDPRIGSAFFNPGPGWGGSCLPKDASALLSIADEAGVDLPIVSAAVQANHQAQAHIVDRVRELVGGTLNQIPVTVLGLSFKAKTSDRRDSPALAVINLLMSAGATVTAYDPTVPVGLTDADLSGIHLAASIEDAARGAHAIVVLTEWGEFASIDYSALADVVTNKIIYDARHIIDETAAVKAGFGSFGIGRAN